MSVQKWVQFVVFSRPKGDYWLTVSAWAEPTRVNWSIACCLFASVSKIWRNWFHTVIVFNPKVTILRYNKKKLVRIEILICAIWIRKWSWESCKLGKFLGEPMGLFFTPLLYSASYEHFCTFACFLKTNPELYRWKSLGLVRLRIKMGDQFWNAPFKYVEMKYKTKFI